MKKVVVLVFAIAAIAALIVPLYDAYAVDGASEEDYQDDVVVTGTEAASVEENVGSPWGFILLLVVFAFFGIMIYLEHKGILKDPLLY